MRPFSVESDGQWSGWLFVPARWALWLIGPGPRIWWLLFDDSKSSAVASVLIQTLAAVLTAVTARLLGQVNYGELATLTTCTGWFGIIAAYPASSLVARIRAERMAAGAPYARPCAAGMALAFGFGTVAMLVAFALLPWALARYHLSHQLQPALLLCAAIPLAAPGAHGLYLLQCFGRVRRWAWMNVAFGSMPILVLLAVAAHGPLTITGYAGAILGANMITAVLGLTLASDVLGRAALFRPEFSVVGRMLKAGVGGFTAMLCANLALLGVNTLIAVHVGRTALGHYQVVATLGAWICSVVQCVGVPALSAWAVVAAQGRLKALRRSLRLRQSGTGALAVLAGTLASVFAPSLLGLIYGPEYRENALLVRLAAPAWAAIGFACWYWIALTALGHPGRVMHSNIVWGSIHLGLAWFLIRFVGLGTTGAMIAYSAAYFAWAATYEIVFRRTLREEAARSGSEG